MNSHSSPTHIVGIGASAGGLAALEEFFKAIPEDSGMAFVVIQHLSPDFKSLMADLLARHTKMPIHRVENTLKLEANAIYLIPPRQVMTMANGHLYLQEREGQHLILPIDIFFESLASAVQNLAIGIVLSGTGSDGSRGIQAIHEAGGLILVQNLDSAQFDGMPRAAIATGLCDFVTTPTEMPTLLLEYAQNPTGMRANAKALEIDWVEGEYAEIFAYLRRGYGLDFSKYKPTTVGRRVTRRLSFNNLSKMSEYVQLLATSPHELDALYRDLLIGVTEFFRDRDAFAYLEREVIPNLLQEAPAEGLRVWVAACATGEEAYSLAILLSEYAEKIQYPKKITIFATDVHQKSLDIASQGIYDVDQLQNVSAEHLAHYFTLEGNGKYRVIPQLRKMVIFAPQNVISDPPFTKIDMICCRNLLIYFLLETQEKVISTFNFAMRMGGVLFLGISEGVGKFFDDFAAIQSTYKIYRKMHEVRLDLNLNETRLKSANNLPLERPKNSTTIDRQVLRDYDRLLNQFMPDGALLNDSYQVLHYFGDMSQYLKPPAGRVDVGFAQMVVEDLHMAVSVALQRAATLKGPFKLPSVTLRRGEEVHRVDVSVDSLPDDKTSSVHYLVTFNPLKTVDLYATPAESRALVESLETSQTLQAHIADLELDLQSARESLQATVEELQTSNEELQATNEELLAANEELQSTNEELHSLNEELYTVNAEYEKKNAELIALNEDHAHLLSSLDVGVVYLDKQLIIRKFNPASASAFKLLPQDIGRPIEHIAYQLTDQIGMIADVHEVLKTGNVIENEAQTKSGEWLLKRIYPVYEEQKVSGAILTFTDVNKIKNAETKMRTMFNLLPVGIVILDKEHNVVETNPAIEKNICPDRTALLQGEYTQWRYIRPDGIAMSMHEFASAQVLREGQPVYDVQTCIAKEDGSLVWSSVSGAPLPDGGMVLVAVDITEQKNMEVELHRNEARYRSLVTATSQIVWNTNAAGEVEGDMPAWREYTGQSQADSQGWGWLEALHPDDRQHSAAVWAQAVENRTLYKVEYRIRRHDGVYRNFAVRGTPVLEADGRIHEWVGTCTDITEKKQAETSLFESEQRARLAIETTQLGIWEWNLKTNKIHLDVEMFRIYGLQPSVDGNIDYADWVAALTADEVARQEDILQEMIRSHGQSKREFQIRRQDTGEIRYIYAVESVRINSLGEPEWLVGTNMDITERKQTEMALENEHALLEERSSDLRAANLELERSARLKDEFLSAISHELRTPLTAILGITESLQYTVYGDVTEKQNQAIQLIHSSGRHLLDMINDLLDFSKIDAGKFDLHPEIISIDSVCQSSLNLIKTQANKKNIDLGYIPEHQVLTFIADPRRLKQVLVNLLGNAVKFTPAHGQITLSVQANPESSLIHFAVADTGIGIEQENLQRIFTPFTQVDGRLNRQYEGTGLGLALVQRLTDMHGGRVTVESEVGRGSCFTIILPLHTDAHPEKFVPEPISESAPPASQTPNFKGSLLLVEDNEVNAIVTANHLRFLGYTVFIASNGQDGVALAQEHSPQLILMDIQMPVMNGLEAIRQLRADPRFATTPIIALTALAMYDDRERCLAAGATEYISKPFRQNTLSELIERLLS